MILGTLVCSLLLLCLAPAGAVLAQAPQGLRIVYGGCLAISSTWLLLALFSLSAAPSTITLPLGLPWIGAHFRLDALAAFFVVVVGLGVSMRLATGSTSTSRRASCRSIRRSSPA
jgi:hydrogenase-4 component B